MERIGGALENGLAWVRARREARRDREIGAVARNVNKTR